MALSIISNQAASIATRSLGQANDAATATAEKLSSGKRINSAKDDAAGSAIAARLSAEVAGLQQAGVNAGQASSMLQIADGAFQNVEDILTRAKSLSVQAGSEQISNSERAFLDQEFQALKSEIARISNDTEFNGTKLVDGGVTGQLVGSSANFAFSSANGATTMTAVMGSDLTGIGIQGLDLMGVQLASDTANGALTTNSQVVGQVGNLVVGSASTPGLATFSLMAAVQTTGGNTVNGTFTGAITTGQLTGSNTNTVPNDIKVTLMATGTMTNGTVTINLGSAFNPTTAAVATADNNDVALVGKEEANFNFKVGTGTVATEDEISVNIGGVSLSALGLTSSGIDTKANADAASDSVGNAIDALQAKRSDVGAAQNRLDFAAQNVELTRENQEAARSELEDLNVAKAITEFSQQQLLVQAGTSTLSQANQLPQNLLQLFR